jgi:hypothetical protein
MGGILSSYVIVACFLAHWKMTEVLTLGWIGVFGYPLLGAMGLIWIGAIICNAQHNIEMSKYKVRNT